MDDDAVEDLERIVAEQAAQIVALEFALGRTRRELEEAQAQIDRLHLARHEDDLRRLT